MKPKIHNKAKEITIKHFSTCFHGSLKEHFEQTLKEQNSEQGDMLRTYYNAIIEALLFDVNKLEHSYFKRLFTRRRN